MIDSIIVILVVETALVNTLSILCVMWYMDKCHNKILDDISKQGFVYINNKYFDDKNGDKE